jgi:hypothetical protein
VHGNMASHTTTAPEGRPGGSSHPG